MNRAANLCFTLIALAIAAPFASAQSPGILSYQGVLTDGAGSVVPDGNYSLTFRLYDVPAGGAALYSETQAAVPVERGGFSVEIGGAGAGIPLAFDRTYYLGIQVGADPELAPRVRLTASPYSMGLRLPFNQSGSSASPLLELQNNGAGADARFHGEVQVGSSLQAGELRLLRPAINDFAARLFSNTRGGALHLRDGNSGNLVIQEPDVSTGGGGFMSVTRGPGGIGFQVDGNSAGSGDSRVSILGSARSAVFEMNLAGNPSVALPNDAISAVEQLDEPGVAGANSQPTVSLDGTVQTLVSRSITCPAGGYCLVIGSAQVNATHVNGTTSSATFGVSNLATTFPTTQDVLLQIPSTAASGTYASPVTVQSLFQVSAGLQTFYFLGQEASGNVAFADGQLTVVYFPTAYGTVTTPEPSLVVGPDADSAGGAAPSAAAVAAERLDAERFGRARLEREMALMRGQMEELNRRLESVAREQSAAVRDRDR